MKRPTGITIIAVTYIVLAALSLIWSGLVFGLGFLTSFAAGLFGADNVVAASASGAWPAYVGIITAVVHVVVCIGLLAMKRWAWYLALIGVGLTVIQGVIGMFTGGLFAFMCGSIGLVIPVIIVIYLLQSHVRTVFDIGVPGQVE